MNCVNVKLNEDAVSTMSNTKHNMLRILVLAYVYDTHFMRKNKVMYRTQA